MPASVSATSGLRKLSHIDLLRGVAILMVIVGHVARMQPGISKIALSLSGFGQTGVQLFFFASAYTLCRSMSSRDDQHTPRNFYIRRFFRIAPLYYLGILIYWGYCNYVDLNITTPSNYSFFNILCNLFFVHGLVYSANNGIVPGGWSIGTEMLFYLIFPLLFLLYSRYFTTAMRLAFPLFALVFANSCMLVIYHYQQAQAADYFYYYLISSQLPVFALGMSYFFIMDGTEKVIFPWKTEALLIAVLLVISYALYHVKLFKYCLNLASFTAGLGFLLLFDLLKQTKVHLPVLQRIGELSFSIYVLHFLPVRYLIPKFVVLMQAHLNTYVVYLLSFFVVVLFSILLAFFSERLIEKPGIALGRYVIGKLGKQK